MRASQKTLIVLSLLVLFSLSGFLTPQNPRIADSDESLTYEYDNDSSESDYRIKDQSFLASLPTSTSGSGTLLHVKEYANGTFVGRNARGNESSTFYQQVFDIPAGWYTTQVTAISSQMYHLTDWTQNGDFSEPLATQTAWSYNENDLSNYISGDYDDVLDQASVTIKNIGTTKSDYYGSWNQTVDVTEGGATSAILNISYMIDVASGKNGQNARPYVYVNGSLWELPTDGNRFTADQNWTTYSLALPLSRFTFPGTLEIGIGVEGWDNTQFQTESSLYIDNVSLWMQTSRFAEVVNLRARDADNQANTEYFVTDSGDGKGYAVLSGNWTGDVTLDFMSNETNTQFTLDLFMHLERNNHLDTNTYTVTNGTAASWNSAFTAREMAFPFTYYYFNVSIPYDWTLSTVRDAYNDIQLSGMTYYNATFYSTDGILYCDVDGTGVSGTPHYGSWLISASAPNYGNAMIFEEFTSSWAEESTYYPDSFLRVNVTYLDGFSSPPTSSGSASIDLYDTEQQLIYSENGGIIDSNGIVTFHNSTNGNITILSEWLAGPITAVAVWTNGTAVGEIRRYFYIYHHTELELETNQYDAFRGDTVSVRVKYIDSETGLGIPSADLAYEWTYGSDEMQYAGNGWYAGYVDTSLAVIGGYTVTVNATKDYYDYAETSGIVINIQEKTTLYSPKNLQTPTTDYEIAWGNSKTVYIAYEDTIAMNPNSITASPGTPSVLDIGNASTSNNYYSVVSSVGNAISVNVTTDIDPYNVAVGDITTLTFKVEGKFSTVIGSGSVYAYNVTSSSWVEIISSYSPIIDTTLTWRTTDPSDFIDGSGVITAQIQAFHSSAFSYSIDLFDFVANRPIDNTAPSISLTCNWPAQTVVGTQTGPVYNGSLKIWQVTLFTNDVTPGEYTILIQASALGHQEKNLELSITVRAHHSRVSSVPPSETPWGWKTPMNISFSDTDNSSIIISEGNVSIVEVSSVYGTIVFTSANWTYDDSTGVASIAFWIDTRSWDVGTYSITITVTSSGSGLSKYFDDGVGAAQIVIRPHDIGITANPVGQTPWGWNTNVTVSLTDLDNVSLIVNPVNITQIIVDGQVFTSSDWIYNDGIFSFYVDTSSWPISTDSYVISVTFDDSPTRFYNDREGSVLITIKSHSMVVSATTFSATPWSWKTNVSITFIDADNTTIDISQANITQITIGGVVYSSSNWIFSDGTFYVIVDSSSWNIGTYSLQVSVITSSSPAKYYANSVGTLTIQVRAHILTLSIDRPAATPWSWKTTVTIRVIDFDNESLIINEGNVTEIIVAGQTFTSLSWIYNNGNFTVVVDTSTWQIGTSSRSVSVKTATGPPKMYNDRTSSVTIEIRGHLVGIIVTTPSATPWSWNTDISFTLIDLDNSSLEISEGNITQVTIAGQVFTSSNWTFNAGTFSCTVNTSAWSIGSAFYPVSLTTNSAGYKYYRDSSTTVPIQIVSHGLSVLSTRPPATPYSDNTTIEITIQDLNNASIIVTEANITQIVINGQVFTSANWIYIGGVFKVNLTTDDWAIGTYTYSIAVSTSGSGVTKYYSASTGSVTLDIRVRYTEAYAATPDPVPSGDVLVFYAEFRDRDLGGVLVNASVLKLNGTTITEGVDFTWISEGYYRITLATGGLSLGDNIVTLTMQRTNYEDASTTVRFRIRVTDTEAIASGYRFNVPLGTNVVFTIQFTDVDHDVGITADALVSNTTLGWSSNHLGSGLYQITITTLDSTPLGAYPIRFNFTKAGYEDAYAIIIITVETHDTFLSFDEAVVPTDIYSNITVYLFYEDISVGTGISNDTQEISISVYYDDNAASTGWAQIYIENNVALGTGHYILKIPAAQFGGIYKVSFIAYFNWTGVAKYENLTRSFSVQLQGTDTDLSVAVAPQAAYYGDIINFTLFYVATQSSTGVENTTYDVHGFAYVLGTSITTTDFQITTLGGGLYRFVLDSSLFASHGSYTIKTYLNWTPDASPFFENQTLSLTITILIRTTLVDVVPPQNTAYDENATFTFEYYDSPSNTVILNSSQLFVQLNNPGLIYWLSYSSGTWTVIVDTESIGTTGTIYLQLNVTWVGAPFYQNQTRQVTLTVTTRPTQLSYTPPSPTYFISNVTMTFTYIDLIDDSSTLMNGNTLTLTSAGLTLSGNYTVIDNGDGTYDLILNTTAFLEPGTYSITAQMTYTGSRFEKNAQVQFNLRVLYRAIVATSDPAGNNAYGEDIDVLVHVTDGETAAYVSNTTEAVRIQLIAANASLPEITGLTVIWTPGTDTYTVTIANTLAIGTHVLYLNVSYDYTSPYYGYKVIKITLSIRKHSTELQLYEPSARTGFGLNTTFQLYYVDLDTSAAITGAVIQIDNGSLSGYWSIVEIGGNIYEVRINTTGFVQPGTYWVQLTTQNSGTYPNFQDASIYVRVYVRERYTLLSYDPVGSVGYTDNVEITVYFSDTDLGNAPITNSSLSLFLTVNQTTYSVANGAVAGSYVITMPANQFVAFTYTDVQINMTYIGAPYYQNHSISVRFQITGTSTEFAWDPTDPVPYGDRVNVTFYWGDLDSGLPVVCELGTDTSITVISLTQPGLDTSNTTILNIIQGTDVGGYARFFLLLNTSYLDIYGTYSFRITIDWINAGQAPYYEDQINKLITITVRTRNTAIPQIVVDSVSYGENATIRLQYVDLDNSSELIVGAGLSISVLNGLTYEVNTVPVGGFYEIYLVTEGTGFLGIVKINMTVMWGGSPFYKNQTSVVAILTVNMKTATMEISYPDVTAYLENSTFYIILQDSLTGGYINNNESFISAVFVTPSIGQTPIITFVSNGQYSFTFNSTILGQLGSYVLTITFDHSGSSPYYASLSRNVTGSVRERVTSLDYDAIAATPYGNYSVFNVTYQDVEGASPIEIDTGSISLTCGTSAETLVENTNYWIVYIGEGIYEITVDTTALGAPSTYVINVQASSSNWWLADSSRNINLKVAYRSVELSATSPDATFYGDITFFIVTILDTDNGTAGTGLDGMSGNILLTFIIPSGTSTSSVSIVGIGNGQYNISFDTDILNVLTDYTMSVSFNAPDYWADAGPHSVTGRVSARPTQLAYDVEGAAPYLDNVSITFSFEDSLTSTGITGAAISLSCGTAAEALVLNTNYWIVDVGSGVYTALIDSVALGDVATFSISAQVNFVGEPFYQNRTRTLQVEVRERATRLTYAPPQETPYGNNISIRLNYYDVDAGLTGIPNAESFFSIDTINGTSVDASYYWVDYVSGSLYYIYINTTKLDIYGRYSIAISVNGNPTYRYDDQALVVDADVRARNTQLTVKPIAQTSYTDNVTIILTYTDLEAGLGINNLTVGGGVHLTLNDTVEWWVSQTSLGVFELLINATSLGDVGSYGFTVDITWINGKPFYENVTIEFEVTITGASATLSYEPPEQVPIGDNITLVLYYTDSDTGQGVSNATSGVHVTITPLNATPGGPFVFDMVYTSATGRIEYTFNSSLFQVSGPIFFSFDVEWVGDLPYYNNFTGTTIRAVIRGIFTQTLADAPDPGSVPIGDSALVNITLYDLDHEEVVLGATITSTWPMGYWSYEILGSGVFNITLDTSWVTTTGKVSAQFTFNRTFYQTKTATVYLTIRLISTSAIIDSSPEPPIVPFGDTVVFEVRYFDVDHQLNISPTTISTSWTHAWTNTTLAGNVIRFTLQTSTISVVGKYYVTFTFAKNTFSSASFTISFEVRVIQTTLTKLTSVTEFVAGENASIIVRYNDIDNSDVIPGATIFVQGLTSDEYGWVDLGDGRYNITFYLWNQGEGTFQYDIYAFLNRYENALVTVDIRLREVYTELIPQYSILIVNWSQSINFYVNYTNLDLVEPIDGAYVTAKLSGTEFVMAQSGESYIVSINSALFDVGTYIITINATKTNYQPRIAQMTVVISIVQTDFTSITEQFISVVSGESINITVYYEALSIGGIADADVSYQWDYGEGTVSGTLSSTGKDGYYSTLVSTVDVDINVYYLYVRAYKENHVEASLQYAIEVGLVDTSLSPVGEATLRVVFGETATLLVNYTNLDLSLPVIGASVLFRFGDAEYNGSLVEGDAGIYNASIDTSQLYSGTFSLYITATKLGYETGALSLILDVQRIDTSITALNSTITIIYEQSAEMYFYYNDTYYNQPIENATLEYRWQGGTGELEDLGDGYYRITLNSSSVSPGIFDIYVTASKTNYMTRTSSATLGISKIEMEILVANYLSTPVGDGLIIHIYINDTSYNRPVTGAEGSFVWALGSGLMVEDTENPGNYTLIIPMDTPIASYPITIQVNKLNYRTESTQLTVDVRPIRTGLTTLSGNNFVSAVVGQYLEIVVILTDLDHGTAITGATLTLAQSTIQFEEDAVQITPSTVAGQYIIAFTVPVDYQFEIVIHAYNGADFEEQDLTITVVAVAQPQDPLMTFIMFGGSIGIIFALIGALLWVKVYSVPKLIRIMNGMIKSLSKAKIPEKPEVSERDALMQSMINEGLAAINLSKPIEEIPMLSIDFHVPETESLLLELSEITGLGEDDIAAFRTDLARMKPSERPGFLNEVIKQEKARRAQEIAEKKPEKADATRKVTTEELQEVGERLAKLGLPEDQIEEVLESAKEMTRAELDAVLEQMDKSLEE